MKLLNKISSYVAITMAVAAIFGCQPEELVGPDALMSESSLTFEAKDAEPQTFMVASDDDWVIDVAEDWITVSPMSGSQTMDVTVTVTDNIENGAIAAPRQGTVTILNNRGYSVKTIIYQRGDNYIGVEEMTLTEVYALEDGKFAKVPEAQVVALTSEGFVVSDEGASMYVTSTADVKIGSTVYLAGEKCTLNGLASLNAGEVTVESEPEGEMTYPSAVDLISNISKADEGKVFYVSTTAGILGRDLYYDNASVSVSLLDPKAGGDIDLDAVNMHNIEITAYLVGYENGTATLAVTSVKDQGINEELEAYFYDDFSWMKPFVAAAAEDPYNVKIDDSVGDNNASGEAPNLRTKAGLENLLDEFLARGYEDLNQSAKVIYPQKYYWKFGKTDNHGGLRLPQIEFKGSEQVNANLTFNWAAHMTGGGNIDNVQLVVEIEEGTGLFENGTNISDPLYTTQTKGHLEWQDAEVLIKGASSSTRIVIRPLNFNEAEPDQQRFHLDNIKIKDTGIPYVDPVYANITLSDEVVTFEGTPGEPATIKIKSDNSWTLTKGENTDWFSLNVMNGAADEEVEVTITCQPSTSINLRHGVITLQSADTRKNIHVVQSAAGGQLAPLISVVGGNSRSFAAVPSSYTVQVQSNVPVQTKVSDDATSWLSVTPVVTRSIVETLNYTVTVTQNWEQTPRTGTITFYNEEEGLESILTVTQESFVPVIETAAMYYISGNASTSTIPVTTNADFDAEITSGSTWLSTSTSHTVESPDITLTVTEANSTGLWRTATLRLYNTEANYSKEITIVQSVAGTIWSDDFEWLNPWSTAANLSDPAGDTVGDNDPNVYCPQLPTPKVDGVSALQALEAAGYQMLRVWASGKKEGECIYLQQNYLKFGKTGYQAGIILPTGMLVPDNAASVSLEFDWCPQRQGASDDPEKNLKIDPVNLYVVVDNNGSQQTFDIPTHGWENGHTLEWIHASVDLSSATINENTTITIKQKEWGVGTANRWFLDNVKIVKK